MQQLVSVWSSLSMGRRAVVVVSTLVVFSAVLGLSRLASQPSLSLLYSGLEPGAAGEVIAALDSRGVAYDVRGGSIFVDSGQRDSLRMTLASEGLPANGAMGYELLDSLSGFGTTSQMFDAAYWRAKEGELARTIAASPQVRTARVHISNHPSNPFQRDVRPKASVAITSASGSITPAQAKALKYLVASAVAGLSPEDVSIIDGNGALVPSDDGVIANGQDRAGTLRKNIQRIVEARVGAGNSVVEVNVETVMDREAIVERRFDPEGRVAIATDSEERSSTASGTEADSVTVASNLPGGDASGGESTSQSENTETRERVNYEVSETTREVVRAPGAVKRISVAVLVDGLRSQDPTTGEQVWEPRPEDELEILRDLIASTIGFDGERGDSITIRSLEFQPVVEGTPPEGPSMLEQIAIDPLALTQLAVLAIVALVLGLFVLRPILATRPAVAGALAGPASDRNDSFPDRPDLGAGNSLDDLGSGDVLTGEIDDGVEATGSLPILGDDNDILPVEGFQYQEDPVDRLRSLIEDRREETVEILRGWMDEDEPEKA